MANGKGGAAVGGGGARPCELCSREAWLYCDSDSAFLCRSCDAAVHRANFLVARHLRQPLCSKCNSLTGTFVYGAGSESDSEPPPSLCKSCAEEAPETSSFSSYSSDCVSSTESSAVTNIVTRKNKTTGFKRGKDDRKAVASSPSYVSEVSGGNLTPPSRTCGKKRKTAPDARAEDIFVIWLKRLGLNDHCIVSSACQALELCLERLTTTALLPFRVCLAASFWVGLRICGVEDASAATCQNLRRLETISGVPSKLIVAVERRLTRVMSLRKPKIDLQEGWAECDDV